ncbi:hypothetical protein PAHAL_6G153500 [Panicum hallii]|uniref:Uncharacterized protein n=1 Tax=Panicum hallii TaxID=206008 RepID=A0A2T8IGC9_9POAL|nr:hypothetical protein PAHAL_6G153500 [Panicum hallii]
MLQVNLWDKELKKKWNLLVVYGAVQDENKNAFLSELSSFCSANTDPILIGGNFNIIRSSSENNKGKGNGVHRHTDLFNSLFHFHELRELEMNCGAWSSNQPNPTLVKLDRILITREWEAMFPLATVSKLPREVSDHNPPHPISGRVGGDRTRKKIDFRFELSWLKHQDFIPKVKQVWDKTCRAPSALDKIQQKLKLFKQYFKGWGYNLQGEWKKRRKEIREELLQIEQEEELYGLNIAMMEKKMNLMSENLKSLDDEELYWYKRAHETWLLEGDNNFEFFHRVANGRKRKSTIFSLKDGDATIMGDKKLLDYATAYYKDIFGPASANLFHLDPDLWKPHENITTQDNEVLCKPFSEEEIKVALFQMKTNKAAGPDSIPIEFYQVCWDVVKYDIVQMFDDFYAGNLNVNRLNYGAITLLPKNADAERIQQYRPICLLNCLYKLITKVLTIRLEPFMLKIIHEAQTAFMKGRNIMSGVMALHENSP